MHGDVERVRRRAAASAVLPIADLELPRL
jgi:hypothetical protein